MLLCNKHQLTKNSCKSKITKFDYSFSCDQDILRFDIPMDTLCSRKKQNTIKNIILCYSNNQFKKHIFFFFMYCTYIVLMTKMHSLQCLPNNSFDHCLLNTNEKSIYLIYKGTDMTIAREYSTTKTTELWFSQENTYNSPTHKHQLFVCIPFSTGRHLKYTSAWRNECRQNC